MRQAEFMARKAWGELSPQVRRVIITAGAVEGALKVAALIDLVRRPAGAVRGSKLRWATAITLINSVGVVPMIYFVRGRRRAPR
jgi:hypothetical protein